MIKIDELPAYVFCNDSACDARHFLTINRDLYGQWSASYTAYVDGYEDIIPQLAMNSCEDFDEIAIRMSAKLSRYKPSLSANN